MKFNKVKYPFLDIASIDIKRNKNFSLNIASLIISTRGIVCVVGANGSGKTTLLEAIVGLLSHETGSIHILGLSVKLDSFDAKTKLGFIPDDDSWIIAELTAREYFDLHIAIYREAGVRSKMLQNIIDMAAELSFSSFDQRIGTLSHGNKKKVQIIAALMHESSVIVVDELRNGLDPISIKSAENLLQRRSLKGATVLAATHDLWWAERMSKRIIMIKDGRILLDESTKKVVKLAGSLENKFMQLYGRNA